MIAKVSERGQVVIPKLLRDRLGIRPGQHLDFREDKGRLVVDKAPETEDAVDAVYGVLELRAGTDALVTALRGQRPRR